jgi:ATP-dependent protease ClpP protease subunit
MSETKVKIVKDDNRVWDLTVPIIVSEDKANIKVYLTGGIAEPDQYNELCHLLEDANEGTTVDLYINTPGGIVDSAFMVADAIQASDAKVVAHLSGTVASAGTLIAMACEEVGVTPTLTFMIHNYSGGMVGKGHEIKARQNFIDSHLNTAFKNYYAGFLTEDEMDKVIEGSDLWMGSGEVTERWANRVSYLKGEI